MALHLSVISWNFSPAFLIFFWETSLDTLYVPSENFCLHPILCSHLSLSPEAFAIWYSE
jgi:hypothetical protein